MCLPIVLMGVAVEATRESSIVNLIIHIINFYI